MTLLRRPSIQLNKSLNALKFTFLWKRTKSIFELEIWQRIKYFLLRQARSTISPLSEHTRTMRLLLRPSVQSNKSLTALKFTFYENAQKKILSSKSDNVLGTFYSDKLDQQLALYQNLLGLWDSYLDPQFNWTSPWLHWNSLYMKTHKNKFWARNLTTYWVLFTQTS